MESFSFYNPTKVHFGVGQIRLLGKEMQADNVNRCLLIAGGGSIRQNGTYDQVLQSLKSADIAVDEVWGVSANPTLDKAMEIIDLAKTKKVDAILAVGGGSVIDTAKTVAAGYYLDDVWQAFQRKVQIAKALPIYTVLTISATGSEMNGNAVITNTTTAQKWGIFSPLCYPRVSIIDPSIQNSLPFHQTAYGAMDAISHIMEYYFADAKALSTLAINEALLKTIMDMTDRLQYNSADLVARSNLAWSATLALNGLSAAGLKYGDWACHSIEHSFSALHPEIAHGDGLAVIFPAWIEYLSEKYPDAFLRWSKNVWHEESTAKALRRFRDKLEKWGLSGSLRDLGIKQDELPILLDMIMISPTIGASFKLNRDEVQSLLMLAF